jgi:hypothetical protein
MASKITNPVFLELMIMTSIWTDASINVESQNAVKDLLKKVKIK